jgi:hypothetical protein
MWENGLPTGVGICKYPDGSSYDGDWKEGQPHGVGKKTLPDGTTFDG